VESWSPINKIQQHLFCAKEVGGWISALGGNGVGRAYMAIMHRQFHGQHPPQRDFFIASVV
jgi:hypothetical protein